MAYTLEEYEKEHDSLFVRLAFTGADDTDELVFVLPWRHVVLTRVKCVAEGDTVLPRLVDMREADRGPFEEGELFLTPGAAALELDRRVSAPIRSSGKVAVVPGGSLSNEAGFVELYFSRGLGS